MCKVASLEAGALPLAGVLGEGRAQCVVGAIHLPTRHVHRLLRQTVAAAMERCLLPIVPHAADGTHSCSSRFRR